MTFAKAVRQADRIELSILATNRRTISLSKRQVRELAEGDRLNDFASSDGVHWNFDQENGLLDISLH